MWAINPISLQFSGLIIEDTCDMESTKITLENIRNDYPDGKPIFLFLDNAAYNRCYEVQEYAIKLGIVLYFLPAYSPNLNLIERLRKYMKKKLVKNRYYKNYLDFYDAFIGFFSNIEAHYSELKHIFWCKFQILKAV